MIQRVLAVALGCLTIAGCADDRVRTDASQTSPCANDGTPITLVRLVRTFQDNGVSLEINERSCTRGRGSGATNLGPTGLRRDDKVAQIEGDVLCDVFDKSSGPKIRVTKYKGDKETYVNALNVNCSIYPSDPASEDGQVSRLKGAFEALVGSER
jgi:hypothetical protein